MCSPKSIIRITSFRCTLGPWPPPSATLSGPTLVKTKLPALAHGAELEETHSALNGLVWTWELSGCTQGLASYSSSGCQQGQAADPLPPPSLLVLTHLASAMTSPAGCVLPSLGAILVAEPASKASLPPSVPRPTTALCLCFCLQSFSPHSLFCALTCPQMVLSRLPVAS